jgi:hypothetical protein
LHRNQRVIFLRPIATIFLAALIASAGIFADQAAASSELPRFDSATFCQDLTSKMLNPKERIREELACMYWEGISKGRLQQHWGLVSPEALKQCMKYRTTITSRSYTYFQGCIANVIGMECLRGNIKCE